MKLLSLPQPSWLNRLGLALTSVLAIAAGFILASLLFTVLLIAGLAVGGWLWWQFRRLGQSARAAAPNVIEGEYIIEPAHPLLENEGTPDREPPISPLPRHPA
ncbi:MAG: hypothetical protein IPL59_22730 [Candidatus Competibacteraceae bacterium]|nr:hypothetical protein [Candidatus Competibacteraceae bacterium]MBK8750637.1 hypothetical protein [Candidatus Competibacteraceae bacterium]